MLSLKNELEASSPELSFIVAAKKQAKNEAKNLPRKRAETPTGKRTESRLAAATDAQLAKGELRKATILACALKIASRHGIEGLTIGELAKTVGMSKSGLFAHFGGRDQLQLAVLELATDGFIEVVMKPSFRQPRGAPRLRALFKNWVQHMNDEETLPGGSVLIAASTELDDRPGLLRDYVQSAQKDLISNIEKAAKLAIVEKHFRAGLDVEQFAWSLYSFVLGYHHFKRMLQDPKAELRLKRSFELLMELAQTERRLVERASLGTVRNATARVKRLDLGLRKKLKKVKRNSLKEA